MQTSFVLVTLSKNCLGHARAVVHHHDVAHDLALQTIGGATAGVVAAHHK
ncbi:unnamed protein product [Strongylus vulgaris]|uniref:Uncharacterized protein n=1 Tax=Strongylus vulgaris TaxID=40348 RepID=A0A3P7JJI4_STRVU|nr:unnamed protein product [Strongylus vulgaris]